MLYICIMISYCKLRHCHSLIMRLMKKKKTKIFVLISFVSKAFKVSHKVVCKTLFVSILQTF